MPGFHAQGKQVETMSAVIIRADGTRVPLGTVHGGTLFQKVDSYIRIKLANFKLWLQS